MDWTQLSYSIPDQDENIRLRQENGELKEQIEQLQTFAAREIAQRDDQIRKLQEKIEQLECKTLQDEPKAPVYGRRDDPLVTEKGMLDGRSNADMAFDQKCQLMEEYRKEFGHLNVRPTDPEKYAPLVQFIVKQRKYYRAFQAGNLVSTVNQERIRKLEELGFEWSRRPDYESEFVKMMEKLKDFKERYGHCCVNVIADADPELLRFVNRQRKFLKEARELERKKVEQETAKNCSSPDHAAGSSDEDDSAEVIAAYCAEEEEEEDDEGDDMGKAKDKKRQIPKHWSQSMRFRIEELDDLFISLDPHEFAPMADKVTKYCRTLKFLKQTKAYHPNSINWYQRFEEFRSFYKEHGHGLVPVQTVKSGGLKHFVRLERAIFNAVQKGLIEPHPVIMKNIQLLQDNGFVYDEVIIKKEEERLMAVEIEKRQKELYYSTPRGQLELLKKEAEEVQAQLQAAQETKKEAEATVNKIRQEYMRSRKKLREAEENVSTDKVGTLVFVRPRGANKLGGRARVIRYSVAKVLNEEVKFYDVVYLDDERVDRCIEGRFIEDEKTVSALLDLGKPEDLEKPKGVITRKRKKTIESSPTVSMVSTSLSKKTKVNDCASPTADRRFFVGKTQRPASAPQSSRQTMVDRTHLQRDENTAASILGKRTEAASCLDRGGNPTKPSLQPPSKVNLMRCMDANEIKICQMYSGAITGQGKEAAANFGCVEQSMAKPRTKRPSGLEPIEQEQNANQGPSAVAPQVFQNDDDSQSTPKFPLGTVVMVLSRGEKKPGGLAVVTNFFASKVLSEFIPFYDVEYVKDKRKDTCIEGRFIADSATLCKSTITSSDNQVASTKCPFVLT